MIEQFDISERRACRLVGLSRTSYREPPSTDHATGSSARGSSNSRTQRRRFGYRRIHDLLAREGHAVNHKRVWRLYTPNELAVRKRRKVKRISASACRCSQPQVNEVGVWTS